MLSINGTEQKTIQAIEKAFERSEKELSESFSQKTSEPLDNRTLQARIDQVLPHSNNLSKTLQPGTRVKVIAGAYKGEHATVQKITPKMVHIFMDKYHVRKVLKSSVTIASFMEQAKQRAKNQPIILKGTPQWSGKYTTFD